MNKETLQGFFEENDDNNLNKSNMKKGVIAENASLQQLADNYLLIN